MTPEQRAALVRLLCTAKKFFFGTFASEKRPRN
jgi:hypothetical protein